MPEWKGEIGRHLDALINEELPDVRKAVRWNSPFYGIEGHGWFLSLHCLTKYVKLTWLTGSQLDPEPPKKTKQDTPRFLDIAERDDIDDEQMHDWIRQSAELPGDDLF